MQDVGSALLRVDVTVVERGGFSQAAEQLFGDRSAMPLQIKPLKEVFGLKLLRRSPKHLREGLNKGAFAPRSRLVSILWIRSA